MNTKFDIGQRVTYPVVTTADGKITGITVGKDGVARYAVGNKHFTESKLTFVAESDPVESTPESSAVSGRPAEKIVPPRFKVGDTVKIVNPCNGCLGAIGLIGKITSDSSNSGLIRTDRGINVLTDRGIWRVNEDGCEPFTELAPVSDKPVEPVKLYCVKSYKLGEWLTKGVVYELSADGTIAMDDGYVKTYDDCMLNGQPFKSYFVPLVKRPAKVGEWVLPRGESNPIKVKRRCTALTNCVVFADGRHSFGRDSKNEYLVLDGYHDEQEE